MTVKRYACGNDGQMYEIADGEYVGWEDYLARPPSVVALGDEIEQLRAQLRNTDQIAIVANTEAARFMQERDAARVALHLAQESQRVVEAMRAQDQHRLFHLEGVISKLRQLQSTPPMQPIVKDANGVVRFKANKLVWYLQKRLRYSGVDLNMLTEIGDLFAPADWEQFYQLLGYSVSGYGDLAVVSAESIEEADKRVEAMSGGT